MEEELKRIECLIERCNQCKLNACITCDMCWSEVQAIEDLLTRYKDLVETSIRLSKECVELEEENKKLNNMYTKEYNEHMEMKRQNGVLRNNERILREENKTLTDEYMIQKHLINADFLKEYVPISVIQNKIDELKEQFRDYDAKWTKALRNKKHPFYKYLIRIEAEIDILQELLEERNK